MADFGNLSGDGRQPSNSFIRIHEIPRRTNRQQNTVSHIAKNTKCETSYVQNLISWVEQSKIDFEKYFHVV